MSAIPAVNCSPCLVVHLLNGSTRIRIRIHIRIGLCIRLRIRDHILSHLPPTCPAFDMYDWLRPCRSGIQYPVTSFHSLLLWQQTVIALVGSTVMDLINV